MRAVLRTTLAALLLAAAALGSGCVPSGTPASEATVRDPLPDSGGGAPEGVAVALEDWVVRPHTPTAAPGSVTFVPMNRGNMPHQFIVIRTDVPPAELPRAGQTVSLNVLEVVGRLDAIPQGESGRLEVTLERGEYVLICNLPAHYAAGMYAGITVN
ncbi:MAG: plastocyanin/azurin family copper-binding protein [Dehalococcoidia bacterium]